MQGSGQAPGQPLWHGTTILAIRKAGRVVIAGKPEQDALVQAIEA